LRELGLTHRKHHGNSAIRGGFDTANPPGDGTMTRLFLPIALLVIGMVGVALLVKPTTNASPMQPGKHVETPTVAYVTVPAVKPVVEPAKPIEMPTPVVPTPLFEISTNPPVQTYSSISTPLFVASVPNPTFSTPVLPTPTPIVLPPVIETLPVVHTPSPIIPEPKPIAIIGDKKFRVMLQMGDGTPKFEVRDGEEVLLKVQSDGIEVRSTDRDESTLVLKAIKKVKFQTPGGEGCCDELQVVSGSGEVIVSGSVHFKYTRGNRDTSFTSERLAFRFGTPGPTPPITTPAPTPVVIPVSQQVPVIEPILVPVVSPPTILPTIPQYFPSAKPNGLRSELPNGL